MPESEALSSESDRSLDNHEELNNITDRIGPLKKSLRENQGDFPPTSNPKRPKTSSGYIRRKSTKEKGQELEIKDFDSIETSSKRERIKEKREKTIAVI